MLKQHMTPLTKKGQVHKHKGKGSEQAAMPDRGEIGKLARGPMNSINDYAKATPMARPLPSTQEGGFGT